ncbi:bifunctional 2',3'-cyclic-nucleotide 2'-phosphodiesterase/3'-nucleotidase [Telluria mixta]|uniref:Bifunctional 2',3'-cyclic-nucleotide 2'-phosphodiesterase/3'-nucleotidase n=1 Tax=Telluria mixta TaxID=34071 RepID=A0ABT2C3X6_9BURK|nr:bifunctional 2',3'-cyclic-nucleotide 2'-phosphodiesterase/3'-nucleotidase [Telluria mixta]MCS0632088.1 bifunctional 2',3'-cyclic-nucleotide 2'-phosphodiesterase/3'-nucleotidase [Telluria mixta]WEM99434.1 bifunctional 2',3'-cyclic-nucleotide 2'-phosphodiesterase/3'-nucleotidase [Telluria mixta]
MPLAAMVSGAIAAPVPAGTHATLAILETTDIHANVVGYDYFKLAADPSFGLDRTATLIAQARREFPNTVLLDNGDTIQGTALGDYQALVKPVKCGELLGVHKVMQRLGYDGGGVGNHDFNYGLGFLGQVTGNRFDVPGVPRPKKPCAGPGFPIVLANVYSVRTRKPLFAPYRILSKRVRAVDAAGNPVEATVKVGIIGFTTPTILSWDKRWLEGRVYTEGVVETAQRYLPEMRRKGADVIVAISHGGLDASPYSPTMENGNYYLAQVPGIDALLLGHAHQQFPNPASTVAQFNLPNVDKARGTVFGVPTVMASLWGKNLGVIRFDLRHDGKGWTIARDQTVVETRASQQADKSYVAADPAVLDLVRAEHEATIRYVQTPVGSTDFRMSTYFADVGDPSAIQAVNAAQADYVRAYVKASLPQYASLPVLSVSAAFKAGAAGPGDYTDVAPGSLALNNAADLYLYPNALYAVKVDGAALTAWLEKAATRFNTIDPARTEPQELVNSGFPSYNFDTVTDPGLRYEIDVTRPPGQRIRNLTWQGKPIASGQAFLVATNNYRASGGGNFPGLDGSKTVIASPDSNRDVLIAWIRTHKRLTRTADGAARSWRFTPVTTAGPVVFHAPPGKLELARAAGLQGVTELRADDGQGKGFALYAVDLSK